jgi:hypothetical protein
MTGGIEDRIQQCRDNRYHGNLRHSLSRERRRVELLGQLRRPLAAIAKDKVVGEIIDKDPDRWSQSSTGRKYKMKGNFLRAPIGEYPNQTSLSDRLHGNFSR